MTKPRTPSGYQQKGNKAEAQVKFCLERKGFLVADGKPTESGADLYVFRWEDCIGWVIDQYAEVKRRWFPNPSSLEPKPKRALARRAAWARVKHIPYRLYFISDDRPSVARVFAVGHLVKAKKRQGLSLLLYEAGLLDLSPSNGPPIKGLSKAPLPVPKGACEDCHGIADGTPCPHAESGAAGGEAVRQGATTASGSRVVTSVPSAAPPAKPECKMCPEDEKISVEHNHQVGAFYYNWPEKERESG